MTRQAFMVAYKAELTAAYAWAADNAKLGRFLLSVLKTLSSEETTWNHSGECVTRAWRAIGGKGRPSLKALRALA